MRKEFADNTIPVEFIQSKNFQFRDNAVMIDRDLTDQYGVEKSILNQAVKSCELRFPADFMFQMTKT